MDATTTSGANNGGSDQPQGNSLKTTNASNLLQMYHQIGFKLDLKMLELKWKLETLVDVFAKSGEPGTLAYQKIDDLLEFCRFTISVDSLMTETRNDFTALKEAAERALQGED